MSEQVNGGELWNAMARAVAADRAPAAVSPHDYSNPYLRRQATGDIRCDACGHLASLAPVTCTPDPSWRARIEAMIAEVAAR